MEVENASPLCWKLSVTGLVILVASFSIPWYVLDGNSYQIFRGETASISSDQVMLALNAARTCLVLGVFFAWLFIMGSFRGRTGFSIWTGWISVGLLLVGVVYAVSRVSLESTSYALGSGWLVAAFGLILVSIAAVVEMNRYFAGDKRVENEDESPVWNVQDLEKRL